MVHSDKSQVISPDVDEDDIKIIDQKEKSPEIKTSSTPVEPIDPEDDIIILNETKETSTSVGNNEKYPERSSKKILKSHVSSGFSNSGVDEGSEENLSTETSSDNPGPKIKSTKSWLSKKIMVFAICAGIFLVLILVILSLHLGSPSTPTISTPTEKSAQTTVQVIPGFKQYENKELGFSLKYPSDWQIKTTWREDGIDYPERISAASMFSLSLSKTGNSHTNFPNEGQFNIYIHQDANLNEEDYLNGRFDHFLTLAKEKDPNNIHIISYGYSQLNGKKVVRAVYSGWGNFSDQKFLSIDFAFNDKNFNINYDASDQVFQEDSALVQQIIDSIILIPTTTATPTTIIPSTSCSCRAGEACCNGQCYSLYGKQICCGGKLQDKYYKTKFGYELPGSCCGDQVIDLVTACCNEQPYHKDSQTCFNSIIYSGAERACGGIICPEGQKCCDTEGGPTCYDPAKQNCFMTYRSS